MQVRNCQTLKEPKRTYKRNGGQIMTYDLNITFDDNLVTGNETIDTQHKEIDRPYPELCNCLSKWRQQSKSNQNAGLSG